MASLARFSHQLESSALRKKTGYPFPAVRSALGSGVLIIHPNHLV